MGVDLARERLKLLEILDQNRNAHAEQDVDGLVANTVDPYIQVLNGQVVQHTREDMRQTYAEYFQELGSYAYECEDLEPPIIQIANDASIAWMITRTRLRIRRVQRSEAGAEEHEHIHAGIVTYRKQAGEWVRVASVGTVERLAMAET